MNETECKAYYKALSNRDPCLMGDFISGSRQPEFTAVPFVLLSQKKKTSSFIEARLKPKSRVTGPANVAARILL